MRTCLLVALLLAGLVPGPRSIAGEDGLTQEKLVAGLQAGAASFAPVEFSSGGAATFRERLGDEPALRLGTNEFDGLRFRAPMQRGDFVWYFNAPSAWGQWYILPATGSPAPGFTRWLNADQVYEGFDTAGETGRLRVAQTLAGSYFQPGREYLLWFRRVRAGGDDTLRGAMAFRRARSEWKLADVEGALALKPQDLVAQATALGSRGARILLDADLFDRDYAEERISSVFFSRRQTSSLGGGGFVTIETAVPPCRTEPSWRAIEARHGPADFTITADEQRRVRAEEEAGEEGGDEPVVDRHYVDYFIFEARADDASQRVTRVVATAANASEMRPRGDGGHVGRWSRPDLAVFHRDGREVGRIYGFPESDHPRVLQEPPPGSYRADGEEMVYQGEGRWTWKAFHPDGAVARTIELAGHRMHGPAEAFDAAGRRVMRATYRDGHLEGDVVEYGPNGAERSRVSYRNGRPAAPSPARP